MKYCFALSVSFLLFLSSRSQEFSYRHYTVRDGLVQNQVTSMFKDGNGYLWLGTKGGVSRFDGLEFKNYTVNDGLVSNLVTRIFQDKAGSVYFCSLKGVSKYQQDKIDTLFLSDTLIPYLAKTYVIILSPDEILILNRNFSPTYFGHYDPNLISVLKILDERGVAQIIYEKNYNKYWLRTLEDEIYTSSGDSIRMFFTGRNIHFQQGAHGNVLVLNSNSIYKPDTLANRLDLLIEHNSRDLIPRLQVHPKESIIASITQKQIAIIDGDHISVLKKKFNFINQLLLDRDDNLWIATETGFYRQVSDAFENFTPEHDFPEYVWSMVEDNDRNIWFASYGNGLGKWDGNNFMKVDHYRNTYLFSDGNYFYTGAIASKNNLLFPVKDKGILKYDGRKFEIIDGIPKGSVLDLYEDTKNQRILAASIAGLIIIEENKKPVLIQRNFYQSKNFLKTIALDKFGRYWLGGDFKITVMDGDEFFDLSDDPYRFNSGAISIFKDHRGNLWIGTSSGLFFHDYTGFTKVAPELLRSQVVSFVEPDSSTLVMGVSEGLAMLNLESFYRDGEVFVEILDEAKGFFGYDCIRNGILLDSDKNIWVAASDRVVKFYPDKLKKDTLSPSVFIQKVIALGSKSNLQFTFSPMHENDTLFQISHDMKDLRFDFHTIHFTAPEKIKYRYRL
ncbi:MAG: two-component regulator propeller domain-containing protein, partial [Bacteroidales bacterium]